LSSMAKDFPPGGILIPIEAKPWNDKQHYLLRRDTTTIGRASDCNVRINHPTVSRIHAELTWEGGTLIITHLSPTNPTLVNGVPIREPCKLNTGDLIEIADGAILRLELFGSGDEASTIPGRRDARRMYAILYADVVAYSRLVEDDDSSTAHRLETYLGLIRRETESADGRIIHIHGDGILLLFTSAVSAVNSAIAWQRTIASLNQALEPTRRMEFRVGINSGDILITPVGSTHGDAINIAVRIEALASPGGILVTGMIRDQLQGRDDLRFEYMQVPELKNLSRKVRVYRLNF
jgi:class 3 adenylate cyclase